MWEWTGDCLDAHDIAVRTEDYYRCRFRSEERVRGKRS
jgi:hypothetical protein